MYAFLILHTHMLVHFNEDNTSGIVPIKRLEKVDNFTTGQQCSVLWSNKKKYPGILMCFTCMCHCILVTIFVSLKDYNLLGSIDACASMQEELEKGEDSDEGDILDNKMLEPDDAGRATNEHNKIYLKHHQRYACMCY